MVKKIRELCVLCGKKKELRSKIRQSKKVWHIFHFGERFELSEDMRMCRKGPLQFVRLPVAGANDNESHVLIEQLGALDCQGDTLVLEAVFWRMVRQAGRRSRKYRGYLLNERYLPMTTTQISRIVKLSVGETARVLKVLARYNLIERAPMPDFAAMADGPEEEGETPRKWQKPKGKGQKPKKTEADGAGGGAVKGAAPAQSKRTAPPDEGQLDKMHDPKCEEFAGEVFVKVFGRTPKTGVLEDRRELCAFAAAWSRAQTAGLKPSQMDMLWAKSTKEADRTGRARRMGKVNSPGAVWMKVFNGRLQGMRPKKSATEDTEEKV